MSNSSLNSNRFLLPSLIFISLVNLGISIYLVASKPISHRIKYVDATVIYKPIQEEVAKTAQEMLAGRYKEMQAVSEEIKNLKNKEKVNGYLTTKQKKNLANKETKFKELLETYRKEHQTQFVNMVMSKLDKVNESLKEMAQKDNYTIMLINQPQMIAGVLQTAPSKKDDITDRLLANLHMKNQDTKKS